MKRSDFCSDSYWQRLVQFSQNLETPCLILDLEKVQQRYQEFRYNFHYADIYYAVKANPHPEVIKMLAENGSNFDIASRYELDLVLGLGITPEQISYGNTIKKISDIKYFYSKGVRLFVSDSAEDLQNLAEYAPGSKVFIRILTEGSQSADWPLSRKFGCQHDMAFDLFIQAAKSNLVPYGISFHVGSQQKDIGVWDAALAKVGYIWSALAEEGIHLEMINLGGGFPASYTGRTLELESYAQEIYRYLQDDFPEKMPKIILEPGRGMVGDAGVLVSEVVLASRKSAMALHRWVYLDAGKFGGLIETLDESIKYPIFADAAEDQESEEVILAGPTCDSVDVLYEDYKYKLPLNLKAGDRLYIFSTGAYTTSYSSVFFNGFPPLTEALLPAEEST